MSVPLRLPSAPIVRSSYPGHSEQHHPLAELLPAMLDAEYVALRESIRLNGLREPITRHRDGRTIDGRHRERACDELGIPVASRVFEGDDSEIKAFVLDINVIRRHLDESQRAMVAARMATMPQGARTDLASQEAMSQDQAADALGIGRSSVQRARIVLNNAEPEIIDAVDQGLLPVKVAADIAKQPREKQLGRLARDQRKAAGTARQPDDFYRTPPDVTRALLRVESFLPKIWEPACGDGAISNVLIKDYQYDTVSSDLVDRGYGMTGVDFLGSTAPEGVRSMITNPPFKLDDEFACHALDLGIEKIAILARLTWLEGEGRYGRLWSRGKLARVWAFSERQTLWHGDDAAAEDDGGMTAYAWFVFEQAHRGPWSGAWL